MDFDRLSRALEAVADAECAFEEAEESGDLEDRLQAIVDLEDARRELIAAHIDDLEEV